LLNINKDKRLEWLTLSSFTMLVYDLSYPEEKTWPVYQEIINRDYKSIFDYVGWLLGIRMYGDKARRELERMEIMGGYELLNALASS
jgi:hypothetical protein